MCFAALASAAPKGYDYVIQPSADHYQEQSLISKHFFLHSAPEEEETEIQHRDIVIGTPRKNFNVVFVKAPVPKQQQTKIRVIPAINEDKTVIYVLAKKAEEAQFVAHVEEPATTTSKPEVFFIKYKTNEEAEHAQHSIQAEYDRLGGITSVSDEGISPVSSVIGSLDGLQQDVSTTVVDSGASHGTTELFTSYLPPVTKH